MSSFVQSRGEKVDELMHGNIKSLVKISHEKKRCFGKFTKKMNHFWNSSA
jgi:hypothetical protein